MLEKTPSFSVDDCNYCNLLQPIQISLARHSEYTGKLSESSLSVESCNRKNTLNALHSPVRPSRLQNPAPIPSNEPNYTSVEESFRDKSFQTLMR